MDSDVVRQTMQELTPSLAPGLAWAVGLGDEVHQGVAGVSSLETGMPIEIDSIFRIASLTKPITAAAVLRAAEDGVLAIEDSVEAWLPELADRRVLRDRKGPIDDTVGAARAITVRDLMSFTAGYGFDFAHFDQQIQITELRRLGLGVGPPTPASMPPIDEWMRRLKTIPLDHQPGMGWRYHFGSEILGVLLHRAFGQPLDEVLSELVLTPAGMVDTAFHVDAARQQRFTTAYTVDSETRQTVVYDTPDGQWSSPPPFPSGGGGLVSTVGDYMAFGRALINGGGSVLSSRSVAEMRRDHLPAAISIATEDDIGWGYGVDVRRPGGSDLRSPGSYGWMGGLGTVWWNDPAHDLTAVLFTNRSVDGPHGARTIEVFQRAVYEALA
jgi:CubicO group peptidase (beta-lactamase class C family)